MTKNITLKLLLITLLSLSQIGLKAEEVPPVTIHVETVGALSSLIEDSQKNDITNLKLSGQLNGTDIRYIRGMRELRTLDLTDVNIIKGGESYYLQYNIERDNIIPVYMFKGVSSLKTILLPNSINTIQSEAFADCSNLTDILIPSNIVNIESGSFKNCLLLDNVVLPNSVKSIENELFFNCTNLKNITLGNEIYQIKSNAFSNCGKLGEIEISNSVSDIWSSAFSGCISLLNISIPNGVKYIRNGAFKDCISLKTVFIGSNVATLSDDAFVGCLKLEEYIVSEENNNYASINGVLFNKSKTRLLRFPYAKKGDYTIPNSVIELKGSLKNHNLIGAFEDCTELVSVSIPNTITSIANYAFKGCSSLENVTIPNTLVSIGSWTFSGCIKLHSITIPNSVSDIGYGCFSNCINLETIRINSLIPPAITDKDYDTPNAVNGYMVYPPFSKETNLNCILYVPKETRILYENAIVWKNFENIIEEDASSINQINKDVLQIKILPNGIYIEAKEEVPIIIYDISGKQVFQSVISENKEIYLDKGIYIIKVKDSTQKVIVK